MVKPILNQLGENSIRHFRLVVEGIEGEDSGTSMFTLIIRPFGDLAPVVQRLDNAIHRINRYPVDKCKQNKPRYPLDSDLSGV